MWSCEVSQSIAPATQNEVPRPLFLHAFMFNFCLTKSYFLFFFVCVVFVTCHNLLRLPHKITFRVPWFLISTFFIIFWKMTNLFFFTHVRCWLPRQMMLVRNNSVLLIVLAWGGGGWGGIFSFVVDCKQTGFSSVQMCVVTNYNQSWCSSVDDSHCDRGGFWGGGWGGDIFVRCWLQTDRMFFGTDVCCNKLQPKLMFFGGWSHCDRGGFGGGGGGYFRSLLIANRQDVLRYRCVL